jgi:hypothetical protein
MAFSVGSSRAAGVGSSLWLQQTNATINGSQFYKIGDTLSIQTNLVDAFGNPLTIAPTNVGIHITGTGCTGQPCLVIGHGQLAQHASFK